MIKVYQTTHGLNGNCLDAVIASLLERSIEDIPHFNDSKDWLGALVLFMEENGYEYLGMLYNKEDARLRSEFEPELAQYYEKDSPNLMDKIKEYDGINGFFFASAYSPSLYKRGDIHLHAVVVDKDFNIIHDPEEAYDGVGLYPEYEELGYNGLLDVFIFERRV